MELVEESKEQHITQVPDYVTLSGFTDELKSRVKVGDVPKRYSLVVLDVAGNGAIEVKLQDEATEIAESAQEKD